ncbi:MAG: prepilin-type N-terminal cleavage/methylation domain-containing protein [Proteobacteria bacterium]|nr:prepilin-type N-terminal cleavage/methylation domain-containing protein [Pseudomonadota bacterium]
MLWKPKNKAFSILELLVVLFIIGLISIFSYPKIEDWLTDREVKAEVNSFVEYVEQKKNEVQAGKYPLLAVGVGNPMKLWHMTNEQYGIQMKVPAPGWTNRNDSKTGGKSYLNYYKACSCCLDTIDYAKWEKDTVNIYQWSNKVWHWMNSNICLSKESILDPGTNHIDFLDSSNQSKKGFVMICSRSNTSNHYQSGGSSLPTCNNSSKADYRYIVQMDRSQKINIYKYNSKKDRWALQK